MYACIHRFCAYYTLYTQVLHTQLIDWVEHTIVIAPMQHILLLLQGEGTTYQTVIATTGEYTYAIIQFASVESGLAANVIKAFIGAVGLPYYSNPSQAANGGTNPDIPGKYIIDLNGKQTIC